MTIEVHLLGGFGASEQGRPIEALRAAASARLFAYLALHRSTRSRRMYLASLFWPDGSEARARKRLSHTLWELQTALSSIDPTLIQADRDTIGLATGADLWVDADVFERQIDTFEIRRREGSAHLYTETLARTIALYEGDLLADHYDEWIEPLRHRLREKYLVGIRHLVQLQKSRGEYSTALVNARRLVGETPLAEAAHAELMRLYWLAGRPDEAIAQHALCAAILDAELGVTPSSELDELKARILQQRRGATAPSERDPAVDLIEDESLVGRTEERSQLLDVVDAAFAGAGGFALLEGQAGMGKTRLLADIADAARWRGATVLWSRRPDQDREPYGPVTSALSSVLRGLRREQILARLDPEFLPLATRLIPGLGDFRSASPIENAWASPDERWQFQEALTQVLLTFGAVEPLLLIIDDLHDIDTETLEFLRLSAPRLAQSQVAVILSFRSHEARNRADVWDLITDLEQRQRMAIVTLGALRTSEIASLAHARSGRPVTDDLIARLERSTGGNPLFIVETIRAIERAGAVDDGAAVIDETFGGRATVERVSQVLVREIDAAPAPVQRLVGALAVWGTPATSATLARLLEHDLTDTLDAIRGGIGAEFITESEGMYALRFEQLGDAARSHLPAEERRALHLRAADAMVAEDPLAPAATLALHYAAAERWREASRFEAAAAARAASLHSYEAAATFYERSLRSHDLAGQLPGIGLLFGLELVLDTLGRRDDQAQILELLEQRESSNPIHQARLLQRRALFLANSDQMSEAIRTATAAVGFAVGARLDPGPVLVTLAKVFVHAGHPRLARSHLDGMLDVGDPGSGLGQAHLALGQALTDLQEFTEALTQSHAALEIFRVQHDTRGQVEALSAIAVLNSQIGDSPTARSSYDQAIALARQIGNRFGEGIALANLGLLCYIEGDAASALRHLNEASDAFTAIGHRRGVASVRANLAAVLHTVIGDDVAAEREASFARRYFTEIGDRRHEAQCLDVLAGVRRRKRAFAVSRRLLENALEMVRPTDDRWMEVQMLRSLAWTECDAGNHDGAQAALEVAIGLAEAHDLDLELPFLFALEARNLIASGRVDQARASADRSRNLTAQGAGMQHIAAWWRASVLQEVGLQACAEVELKAAHKHLQELLEPFEHSEREAARSRIAEHRQITEAYASRFPRTAMAMLVPDDNPALDPCIQVQWTVHHPDDLYINDKKERRHHRLLRIIDEARLAGARPRLEDLAQALDTSISTLKRDLSSLRAEGRLE